MCVPCIWNIGTRIKFNAIYALHTENPIYVFPEMKLRGLVPNSYIHVSCRQKDPGNMQIAHRYMNVVIWKQNTIILFWK
jgi:hypothetical protein